MVREDSDMSRQARIVIPGIPHHVTQRGNRRAAIFNTDDERRKYLQLIEHYMRRYGMRAQAYCLMDNHVHWVVTPAREGALGETFREVHGRYGEVYNRARSTSGHVFQARFFSCPLDEEHLWAAVRYVERNPVRAGMVIHAEDYPWSSAAAHCDGACSALLDEAFPPAGVISNWRDWLRLENGQQTERLRRQTLTGRPCGGSAFLAKLEALTNRVLQPLKRGRKSRLAAEGQCELFV